MAREFAIAFYNSRRWKMCRRGYIDSVNGLCERCLKAGRYMPGEMLHHRVELTARNINNCSITLSWDNLEYLCATCHQTHHATKYGNTAAGLAFDDEGRLITK